MLFRKPALLALHFPLPFGRVMSSSAQSLNAAGLFPKQSKALEERQPEGSEVQIINALKELYSCKPQSDTYNVYTQDAQFHDPIGRANGLDSIKAQFNGLAQIFSRATIHNMRLLKNPGNVSPHTMLIDQDVEYHLKQNSEDGHGIKTVNSLLTIERNPEGFITKHTEEWDHEKTSSAEDGTWFGKLNDARKKLTASLVDKMAAKECKSEL